MKILMSMPSDWSKKTIDSICLKTEQWIPSKDKRDSFLYIDVSSVSNSTYSIKDTSRVKAETAPGRARKIVKWQDTIFATIRPSLKRVAFITQEYEDQIASTAFCVIRPNQKQATPLYVYFFLLSDFLNSEITGLQHGASYPAVTDKDVLNQTISLPPLTEQQKIAAILFKIQKAIEIQESIIEKTQELKKSTLYHVFTHGLRGEQLKETEIGPIPESWDVVPIGKVYDFTKKPKEIIYTNYDHLPFIAMDLIPIGLPNSGKFKFKKSTEISSGTYVEDGDILLSKITPCFENGKQCIVTGLPDGFGIASTEVIPIKEKPGISDKYLLYYHLLKDDVRKLIAGKMEGATGRQRVPVNLLQKFMIPFPSLTEQQEMAELFLSIDQKNELHTAKKSSLQDLFKTMLNKLMTGEIRVKDLDMDVTEVGA